MKDPLAEGPKGSATPSPSVAVIIAAHNAAETIGKAVISALAQPQTTEVVLVDDASEDGTSDAAHRAGAGDPRLTVIRNEQNLGPSASRNLAISASSAPYIAILDGDDYLLERRFKRIFEESGWDFCADNIVFFKDESQIEETRTPFDDADLVPMRLGLKSFILGNIPDHKRPRAELGFLKPVMRRGFMTEHNLAYAEECRLGEDFLFYAEALMRGAVYTVVPHCGYAALVRENSLSGRHSLEDLMALYARELQLCRSPELGVDERRLIKKRARSTLRRIHHREVLARKAASGSLIGAAVGITRPTSLVDIFLDRMRSTGVTNKPKLPRPLLLTEQFQKT